MCIMTLQCANGEFVKFLATELHVAIELRAVERGAGARARSRYEMQLRAAEHNRPTAAKR